MRDFRFGDEEGLIWEDQLPTKRGASSPRTFVPSGPPPDSDWTSPTDFPRLSGDIGLDLETRDPNIDTRGPGWCFGDGEVVGIGLAWGDGGKAYYPIGHEGGGNLDRDLVLRWLGDQLRSTTVRPICHNAQYDLGWLRYHGIRPAQYAYDTQSATALLDENRKYKGGYSLDSVAKWLVNSSKDETLLQAAAKHYGIDPKQEMWKLPARFVGPYGEQDASVTLAVWYEAKKRLEAAGLWSIFELETEVTQVLLDMREAGVRVDVDKAVIARDRLKEREKETAAHIRGLVGFDVSVNAAESVAKAFDKQSIAYPRTALGAPSFTREWLEACNDPLAADIVELRRLTKTRTTFIEGSILQKSFNGRLHAQFNPLANDEGGTVSGRFSSSKPNLQNQPSRDKEIARLIRGLFLPEENQRWMCADYSAQEPRLAVHFADCIHAPGARAMVKRYLANPKLDLHQWVADLMHIERFPAKTLNLAIMYGRGDASVCHDLGLPTEVIQVQRGGKLVPREIAGPEGTKLIGEYHNFMPFMKYTARKVEEAGRKKGYVKTILGRHCHLEEERFAYKLFNRLVQGSAADQGKKALCETWRAGYMARIVVHDEQNNSVENEQEAAAIKDIMEHCVPLRVPSLVDVYVVDNWGEAK